MQLRERKDLTLRYLITLYLFYLTPIAYFSLSFSFSLSLSLSLSRSHAPAFDARTLKHGRASTSRIIWRNSWKATSRQL